jgi:hypothetical protein
MSRKKHHIYSINYVAYQFEYMCRERKRHTCSISYVNIKIEEFCRETTTLIGLGVRPQAPVTSLTSPHMSNFDSRNSSYARKDMLFLVRVLGKVRSRADSRTPKSRISKSLDITNLCSKFQLYLVG